MEHQISQAVQIALSRDSDANLKSQAIEFITQIKSTKDGYDSCLRILLETSPTSLNDEFKFFIVQVLEENLDNLSEKELVELNTNLLTYLTAKVINQDINQTNFIKNKFSHLMAQIFCKTYLVVDENYLKNWLSLLGEYDPNVPDSNTSNTSKSKHQLIIDYYLRLLISIHEEIGDKLILRNDYLNERNTHIKDKIRMSDMNDLIKSWYSILQLSVDQNNDALLNNCLTIVGQYVNWMEISLFIDHNIINLIITILINKLNIQSCLTIIEILSKKMKSENKFQLINLLNLSNLISSINLSGTSNSSATTNAATSTNSNTISNDSIDLDFLEHLAKLINAIGVELCYIIDNPSPDTPNLINDILNYLINLWPFIFNFLSNDFDEISIQSFPFIQYYLSLSKKNPPLIIPDLFETLLNKIILKMKFDDADDGDSDDVNDEFFEFRSKLKLFQDTIAGLTPELYLNVLPVVINQSIFDSDPNSDSGSTSGTTSPQRAGKNWQTVELGLYELINFNDSIKNNLINYPKSEIMVSKPMGLCQEFLIKLMNVDLQSLPQHPLVQLNYFEIIIKIFPNLSPELKINHELIYKVLNNFLTDTGVFSENDKVKFRTYYLLFRFIKLIKPMSLSNGNYLHELLVKLSGLLNIKAELPQKRSDDDDDDDDGLDESSAFSNQLYLFESIGLIISIHNIDDETKLKFIDLILQPLFNDLENLLKFKDSSNPALVNFQIHHNFMAMGTFIRGYHYEHKISYSNVIIDKFLNCAQVIVIVLENFNREEIIRESARFSFARLIIPILQDHIIHELNKFIMIVLSSSSNLSIIELTDFIAFINQIIHSYKDNENMYNLLNNLLSPVINKVFELLKVESSSDTSNGASNPIGEHLIRDKITLKKSLLSLVSTIILNHQTSLLITETNKLILPELLSKIFEFCYEDLTVTDVPLIKTAVVQLMNLNNVFRNGKINDDQDKFSNISLVEGIDDYLINNSIKLTFELSFKSFDNQSIIQELANLLKSLQLNNNDPVIQTLATYLDNNGINNDLKIDFINNLIKLDVKSFKKYFMAFIAELTK